MRTFIEANATHAICRQCKEEKPLVEFRRRKGTPSGHIRLCKKCHMDNERPRLLARPKVEIRRDLFVLKCAFGWKYCPLCNKVQEIHNFYGNITSKDGFSNTCISCAEDYRKEHKIQMSVYGANKKLIDRYGITTEEKNWMILSQGGRCAICRTNHPGNSWGWHTDHNHETGEVRGILCLNCNLVVGKVENGWDVEVPAVTKYLELYS